MRSTQKAPKVLYPSQVQQYAASCTICALRKKRTLLCILRSKTMQKSAQTYTQSTTLLKKSVADRVYVYALLTHLRRRLRNQHQPDPVVFSAKPKKKTYTQSPGARSCKGFVPILPPKNPLKSPNLPKGGRHAFKKHTKTTKKW